MLSSRTSTTTGVVALLRRVSAHLLQYSLTYLWSGLASVVQPEQLSGLVCYVLLNP